MKRVYTLNTRHVKPDPDPAPIRARRRGIGDAAVLIGVGQDCAK